MRYTLLFGAMFMLFSGFSCLNTRMLLVLANRSDKDILVYVKPEHNTETDLDTTDINRICAAVNFDDAGFYIRSIKSHSSNYISNTAWRDTATWRFYRSDTLNILVFDKAELRSRVKIGAAEKRIIKVSRQQIIEGMDTLMYY